MFISISYLTFEIELVIISLVVEIVNYANQFYEEAKYKHLPTRSDLNPNTKFLKNKVLVRILNDKELIHKASRVSSIWIKNDHDIIRKLFSSIVKSDLYSKYLESDNCSDAYEKKFVIDLMNDYILNNQLVHHM